jgi:diguanylate cyclase (GGDEF)-like protein
MESKLGLSDWEAGATERRGALFAGLALLLAALTITPFATRPVPLAFPPLFGMIIAASIVGTAITAIAFYLQARTLHSVPTTVLAAGFCFAAATMLPYAIIYPGLLGPATGLVRATTIGSLWFSWHVGMLASIVAFEWLRRSDADPATGRRARAVVIGLIAAYVILTTAAFAFDLPQTVDHDRWTPVFLGINAPVIVVLASAVLVTVLRRKNGVTVLDLWLGVVAFANIVDVYLMIVGYTHFTVGWYASRLVMLVATIAVLGVLLRRAALMYAALAERAMVLEGEAHTDILTGLPNRRRFDEEFARAFGSTRRRNGALALAIIDIDRFKLYNDAFGHQAGDVALHAIGQAIADSVSRSGDFAARYGGEEFVIILEDTTLAGAVEVAERVRAAVDATGILAPSGAPLTVSAGVAVRHPTDSADDLLHHADEALYRAKDATPATRSADEREYVRRCERHDAEREHGDGTDRNRHPREQRGRTFVGHVRRIDAHEHRAHDLEVDVDRNGGAEDQHAREPRVPRAHSAR